MHRCNHFMKWYYFDENRKQRQNQPEKVESYVIQLPKNHDRIMKLVHSRHKSRAYIAYIIQIFNIGFWSFDAPMCMLLHIQSNIFTFQLIQQLEASGKFEHPRFV